MAARRAAPAAAAGGFTLLELVAVLGVLSILMGLGMGFLTRSGTELDQAVATLRDAVRMASVTAQSRSAPTELRIARADGEPVRLLVQGLAPVGAWHLEPDERWISEQLRADVVGEFVPGRFGSGLRPDLERKRTALVVQGAGGRSLFDLRGGFLLRVDLRLDERHAATVVRLGRTFELGLGADAAPDARVTLRGPGGKQGPGVTARGEPLPVGRWVTVDVAHDGRRLALRVDGRQVAEVDAAGAPFQRPDDDLELSPGRAPVAGVIDELQLWAYEVGVPADLPLGVTVLGPAVIPFDAHGSPPAPVTLSLELGDDRVEREVMPGGVLR